MKHRYFVWHGGGQTPASAYLLCGSAPATFKGVSWAPLPADICTVSVYRQSSRLDQFSVRYAVGRTSGSLFGVSGYDTIVVSFREGGMVYSVILPKKTPELLAYL